MRNFQIIKTFKGIYENSLESFAHGPTVSPDYINEESFIWGEHLNMLKP